MQTCLRMSSGPLVTQDPCVQLCLIPNSIPMRVVQPCKWAGDRASTELRRWAERTVGGDRMGRLLLPRVCRLSVDINPVRATERVTLIDVQKQAYV